MSSDRFAPKIGVSNGLLEQADRALSVDFCPWANKYVYWLKNPFSVLMLAIAGSAVCGTFLNPMVFMLTGLLVIVTAIGVGLPWLAIRRIQCKAVFDVRRTRVGQPALVRLVVRNRWPLPVWGLSLIRGFVRDTSTDGDEGVAFARVPGWSTVEFSWPFEPTRRGRYPNEPAVVETSFPFGLFRANRPVDVEGELLVWPRTIRLEGMPDASEAQLSEEQFSERRTGEFGDMMGTRLFRPGDSLRRVHWAQTARQQTLIVTERQAPAMTSVRVVLDLSKESHPPESREETVELCVETAASICESLRNQHSRIELVLGDNLVIAGDAAAGFDRLMDTLAVADVEAHEQCAASRNSGFEIRVTTEHGRKPGHAHQVVIGDQAGGAWISVADRSELSSLSDQWRGACHGA